MKTIKYSVFVAAMVMAVACSKEAMVQNDNIYSADLKCFDFTSDNAKIALGSDNTVSWTTGDKISVFSGKENCEFTLKEIVGNVGKFEGTAATAEEYMALYPYDGTASIDANGNIVTQIPSIQTGVVDGFDKNAVLMVARTTTNTFSMKNVGGLIEIDIQKSGIKAVTVTSKGNEYMTGKVNVSLDNPSAPVAVVENGSRTVTLVPAGDTFAAGKYYIAVLAQTYTGGINVIYTAAEESGRVASTTDLVVARSQIRNIKNIESALVFTPIIDLVDPEGTGATETANCYVPGSAGRRYSFPATIMGNGVSTPADNSYTISDVCPEGCAPGITASPIAPKSAKLLWQTAAGLIKDVTLINGRIHFTTAGSTDDPLVCGNALIAAFSGDNCTGDILWSWHLWVTDADLAAKEQIWHANPQYDAYSNIKNPIMMDRNLGALTNEPFSISENNLSHGLLYQWGRKDPFLGSDDATVKSTVRRASYNDAGDLLTAATSATSPLKADGNWQITAMGKDWMTELTWAKFPMSFAQVGSGLWFKPTSGQLKRLDLWGCAPHAVSENYIGSKTIMDPCPAGYRVPNQYVFSNFSPSLPAGGKWTAIKDANLGEGTTTSSTGTCRTDGGFRFKYDGTNTTWIPTAGEINKDDGKPRRAGDYADYWTNAASSTSSYQGMALNLDYNNCNPQITTAAGYGRAIRCEKIR